MTSHRSKLEQVLDLLINEEQEQAEELLHEIMVEKARAAYQDLVQEDFGMEDEEEFGGSETEDFGDEIALDQEEIDHEEETGDFIDDEEGGEDEEVEDRVEDLEAALAELRAEFDEIMGDQGGEEDFDDEEEDFEDEGEGEEFLDDEDEDALEEATQMQKKVQSPKMNQEGELTGTGAHSQGKGETNTKSPYTEPTEKVTKPAHTDFSGGSPESGSKASRPKDHTPSDNTNVKHTKAPEGKAGGEGEFTGTGEGSKRGEINKDSTLGHKKAPQGPRKSGK